MPSELKRWSPKRTVIDYNQISGLFGQYVLICIDRAVLEIAAKYLAQRGKWQSSYLASIANDRQYYTIDDTELDNVHNFIDQFLDTYGGVEQMNCDIVSALEAIANGMSGGCGCGSHGAPTDSPPLETDEFGDPQESSGTPPDGYSSWNEYRAKKCDIASWIVIWLKDDLAWLQVVDLATITAGALSAGLLAILSAGTLIILVGILVTVAAYGIAILGYLIDAVNNNFSELKCALWQAESAADSIANFETVIDAAIDAETTDSVARVLLKQLARIWLDTTMINLMYADKDTVDAYQIYGGQDCTDCGLCESAMVIGTGDPEAGGTLDSAPITDHWELTWNVGTVRDITVSLTGYTSYGLSGINDHRVSSDRSAACDGSVTWDQYDSDTNPWPDTFIAAGRVSILSATEFSASVSYS